LRNLGIDKCLLKQSVSEFRYYCPVTWKNEKLLVKSVSNKDDCVLYKNAFYYFRGTNERDQFIKNPSRFIVNVELPKPSDLPLRVMHHKAAEAILHEKALNAHCSVTLMDEERVKKGDPILLILFKDGKYVFDTENKLQRFLANPFKYAKAVLPVKMPPPEDKISLFNLQKMEDSIAFME
jgi:YHS domain-containing protein